MLVMRFKIGQLKKNDYYYIFIKVDDFDKGDLFSDQDIADALSLKINEFQEMLSPFNNFIVTEDYDPPIMNTFFHTKEDTNNAFKYLTDKYEVLLKLLGD